MKRACPICKRPADSETSLDFPFCNERCRLLDLGNWSSEKYVISSPAFDESMFEKLDREMQSGENEPPAALNGSQDLSE